MSAMAVIFPFFYIVSTFVIEVKQCFFRSFRCRDMTLTVDTNARFVCCSVGNTCTPYYISVTVKIKDHQYQLGLFDTAGQVIQWRK